MFVSEEAQVSYRRMEDTFKQETALYRQKIEEIEATNRRELAARDTKHSQERAECEHFSSLHRDKLQIYKCLFCYIYSFFFIRMKCQWFELGKFKLSCFYSGAQDNIKKLWESACKDITDKLK
jgi:hypothetical protein